MGLLEALNELDATGEPEVFDAETGCSVYREYSYLWVRMSDGEREVESKLEDLIAGPCAGYRGKALDRRVGIVMAERLEKVSL